MENLSGQQLKAIDLLIAGHKQIDVASEVGCDTSTLWRWLKSDHEFIAALNAKRIDIYTGQTDRLRSLASKAIEVLESALDSENEQIKIKAAMQILKSCSLAELGRPSGPTSAEASLRSDQLSAILNML